MKRKIKKYLFHVNEVEQYKKLLNSSDQECVKLGIEMFINSKTYKHYIKQMYSPVVIKFFAKCTKNSLIDLLRQYSHLKYKKPVLQLSIAR